MMEDTDKSRGRCKLLLRVAECYSLRVMFEILKSFSSITMIWRRCGVQFIECSQDNNTLAEFNIRGCDLLAYSYDDRLGDLYAVGINADSAYGSIKNEGKKDPISLYIEVDILTLSNEGLFVEQSGEIEAFNYINASTGISTVPDHVDYLGTSYLGCDPNSRITTSWFSKAINVFKTMKCNKIVFSVYPNTEIFIEGLRDQDTISACRLPTSMDNGKDPEPVREAPTGNLKVLDAENGSIHVSTQYKIVVAVTKFSWVAKICRLAPGSILKVYMSPGCPLVLATSLGLYGTTILSFNSNTDENWGNNSTRTDRNFNRNTRIPMLSQYESNNYDDFSDGSSYYNTIAAENSNTGHVFQNWTNDSRL